MSCWDDELGVFRELKQRKRGNGSNERALEKRTNKRKTQCRRNRDMVTCVPVTPARPRAGGRAGHDTICPRELGSR